MVNRLRYLDVTYLSLDKAARGYPFYSTFILAGKEQKCLSIYSRRKKLPDDIPDWLHAHRIPIYPLLKACAEDGIDYVLINPRDKQHLQRIQYQGRNRRG